MLLNTWLTAAKRHLFNSSTKRGGGRAGQSGRHIVSSEALEARSLLTALVINSANLDSYLDASGGITITDLQGNDTLVIEEVDLASTGAAITINLDGVSMRHLAIETVNVTAFSGTAIDITLTDVTDTRTIALEDINIVNGGSGQEGIRVRLDGTDTRALTIEDTIAPSISVFATNGADIIHGVITENEVLAPADVRALVVDVSAGATANNFHITNNTNLQALNRDAVLINLNNAGGTTTDGLRIANNVIGNEPGADVLFRANGDTFTQPFQLTNNGLDGEQLLQFTLDLTPLGLVFDEGTDGKAFTVTAGSDVTQAEVVSSLNSNNQILVVDVTAFTPGETLLFVIDVDVAPDPLGGPPIPAAIFGNDLIGANVQFNFDAGNNGVQNKQVAGVMVGDPEVFNASFFARGADAALNLHGINLNLTNSPLSNVEVFENIITGVAGNGLVFDAKAESDITGVVFDNTINSSGQDGIRFALSDSNFDGAVIGNEIGANGGYGINFQPVVSRSGFVEEAFDGSPIVITSTNHQLQTGDVIVIQGMTNANPRINHPGNGIHTITRLGNDTFQLTGVSGSGFNYNAGGAWYVPDFEGGVIAGVAQGPARGLVSIDVKADEPEGRITAIRNPVGVGDVQISSIQHGLQSGDRVRISGATGTLLDGDYKISVIDINTFSLDGANAVGPYDTSEGLARWQTNLITGATADPTTGGILLTSIAHGLKTGDEVRISGVGGVTAANGTFKITRLSADTFVLLGTTPNGVYVPTTGYFTPIAEFTQIAGSTTGRNLVQQIADNTISANGKAGIYVNLSTGTAFEGDILRNQLIGNSEVGLHIESHSYGEGSSLPLDPSNPLALPTPQDVSFDVNIGSEVTNVSTVANTISRENGISLDGNFIDNNGSAGIAIEVLDLATGSFEILGNKITNSVDDGNANTAWAGDGIYVALESDLFPVDANSLLIESVIENNLIGVDGSGNAGNGLNFQLTERTRIQDLEVVKNFFGNNGQDGFHFVRTENGSLNSVVFEDNESTNNRGDGFDLYAENSVDDRLDFQIRRNDINNNAEYGVRIDVQAAARIEVDFNTNDVFGNGHTPRGNGFHPNDGVAGSTGAAGGVGIFGFEEVEIVFNAVDSRVNDNFGDGISIDAFDYRDTLRVDMNLTDVELNRNSLTGLRSHGATYANFDLVSTQVMNNDEDGVRIVAVEDKTVDARLNVRVGGGDISFTSIGGSFNQNGQNGVLLGQAVSAKFGTGSTTSEFTNTFDRNGNDGLKITQDLGPTLTKLGRRRTIEANGNFFRNNGSDGIDVGHDASLEGGNVEHGHEVASDVNISINNAIISGNSGDGIEYLADSIHRVFAGIGTGQDILTPNISSLHLSNSRVEGNGQRGIDILNRTSEDSRITLTNNEILSNTWSGVYVVNTMSHYQLQSSPSNPLHSEFDTIGLNRGGLLPDPEELEDVAIINSQGFRTPNIELRVQYNNILDNGNQASRSTVPLQFSQDPLDDNGIANADWISDYSQVTGTLGGLVVRVGTADTFGDESSTDSPNTAFTANIANPTAELGLSGVDAEVLGNRFNGNFGASVFFDSFVSVVPPQTQGFFHDDGGPPHPGLPTWTQSYRDPLARLDLVFRENTGNSLDVTNGFAYVDNDEHYFKSRQVLGAIGAPNNHGHADTDPDGHHLGGAIHRARNSTRTLGMVYNPEFLPQGNPVFENFIPDDGDLIPIWPFSYEGYGTSTWRVERGHEVDGFDQTSTTQGFSTFTDTVRIHEFNFTPDIPEFRWDTGQNTSVHVGNTPYSLSEGDVFNVRVGEDAIQADGLEENDSFVGAYDMGVVSGAGFLVNDLTNASLQPGILNIERKGDRDYYKFTTPQAFLSGNATEVLDIQLTAVDAIGDNVQFMIYEVTPQTDIEERPMLAIDGAPQYRIANAGSTAGTLQVSVKPNVEYVIEVLSTETSNLGDYGNASTTGGTIFNYGTTRSYTLNIDAPVGVPAVLAAAPSTGDSGSSTASGPGFLAAANVADADPFVDSISTVGNINTARDSLTVTFSEDVTGVDITDFRLRRNGAIVAMPAAARVTVNDFQTYTVSGLNTVTGEAGTYVFEVLVASSNIIDTDKIALIAGANDSTTWTVTNDVNTFFDTVDNNPGDGLAADANGSRSLRAAINEANASIGHDVVELGIGRYDITIDDRFEDAGLAGDFDILDHITIRGKGAGLTIIDAHLLDRVFHVFPGASLTLEDLTIQNGEAFDGGGIFVEGISIFNATAVTAPPIRSAGTVNLKYVNVIDSEAYNQGGGVYNLGVLSAVGSSISRNDSGSRGGGIFNHGEVRLVNSTISTNTAVSRGGGIFNERLDGTSVNTTIFPVRNSGSVYALNATIAFNTAESVGGGLDQEGAASFQLGNTIVDRNVAREEPASSDLVGSVNSLGYNFFGFVANPAAALLKTTDVAANQNPLVTEAGLLPLSTGGNGTLANQLGQTLQTPPNQIDVASFAVDAGSTQLYLTQLNLTLAEALAGFDQVGSNRLVEGTLDSTLSIDMGAVEWFANQPVANIIANPNPAGVNEIVTLDGTTSTHTLVPGLSLIDTYQWDFTYDGVTFNVDATGATTSHSYPAIDTYTVALLVTDINGAQHLGTVDVIVDAPGPPVITHPFGAGTSDLTPTIRWSAGTGTFALEVTDSNGNVVISQTGLTQPNYTPTTNLAPGTYTAVVTASNASGSTPSAPYQFTVVRIGLTDPLNFDREFDTTPEFTFTAIPDADRYQIWVAELDPNDRGKTLAVVINDSFIDANQARIIGTNLAQYEPSIRLAEGFYRVWVRAIEVDGNFGDWSIGHQFTIEKPSITGPAFGTGITIDSTPLFKWTDVGANQYQLWVTQLNGTAANGVALTSSQVVINTVVTGTQYQTPAVLGNGDFRAWVRALDDDGEAGLWSAQYNFTKNINAGPNLISPIKGATTTDRTPVFEWQALTGATHYELWVNNSTLQVPRVIYNANVPHVDGPATIKYTDPSVVLRNATYRWWVRAFNEDGQIGGWSSSATFFVPTPVMTSPTGVNATTLPVFNWTGVPEYVRYELWVNNITTGTSRVIYEPGLTATTFTPALPLENGQFRAWVRGFDKVGNASQWSNPITFDVDATINNAPMAVGTVAGTDNSPTFIWRGVPTAVNYQILVKNLLVTGQPIVLDEVSAGTADPFSGNLTYSTNTNLSAGTYRWWIRGLNADGGTGPWSQPLDFIVVSNQTEQTVDDMDSTIMLTSMPETGEWSDDLHSITVHPVAVVAAWNPVQATEQVVDEIDVSGSTQEELNDVDSIMEEMSIAGWLSEELMEVSSDAATRQIVSDLAVADPALMTSADTIGRRVDQSEATMLGLVLAGLTVKPTKRKKEDE